MLLNRAGERLKLAFQSKEEMLNPDIVQRLGTKGLSASGCEFVFAEEKDDKPEQVGIKTGKNSFWFCTDFLVEHNLFKTLSEFAECTDIS